MTEMTTTTNKSRYSKMTTETLYVIRDAANKVKATVASNDTRFVEALLTLDAIDAELERRHEDEIQDSIAQHERYLASLDD
jgi:hypothetical protein